MKPESLRGGESRAERHTDLHWPSKLTLYGYAAAVFIMGMREHGNLETADHDRHSNGGKHSFYVADEPGEVRERRGVID
jgi:hypothetical protein